MLLLGVTQLLVGGVLIVSLSGWLAEQVDNNLVVTASQMASVLFESDEPQNPIDIEKIKTLFQQGNLASQTFLHEQVFVVRLIDRTAGAVVESSADYDLPLTETSRASTATYETLPFTDQANKNHDIRVYNLPLTYAPGLSLQVGMSLEETQEIRGEVLRLMILSLVVTAFFALLSGWFLAGRALIPVRAISATATRINASALTQRLDLTAAEIELEQLVQTFNAMLDRIEQAFQRQRQFTADAAHELRTPLSIMQTGLDVTLSRERQAGEYRETLESVAEEVQRLSQLANSLLRLALNDAPESVPLKQPINLTLLLESMIEQFEGRAAEKHITLKREIAANLHITGDGDGLIQVIFNLLDNAVKFTPEGGRVCVTANTTHTQAQVIIADTGTGISAADLPHIFERFYRVDQARTRQQVGFGLGLAIVRQIVEQQGGTIQAVSATGNGTQFVINLPVH